MCLTAVRSLALGLVALIVALLVLPLGQTLAAGTLDQSQTSQTTSSGNLGPGDLLGQTFTAGLTGLLDQVNIAVTQTGSMGTVTVEIRTVGGGGLPTSTVLGSGTVPMASLPPLGAVPYPFTPVSLTSPASVVAGTKYAIVLFGDDSFQAGVSDANPYAGGQIVGNVLGSWVAVPTADLAFQTFVTQAVLSVGNAQAVEGNGGVSYLVFPVTLGFAVGADVMASYTLADGSATGGAACGLGIDFVNIGGGVVIPAGSTGGGIVVPICGETSIESDETLTVTLGVPTHAVLGTSQALGTIQNDDAEPATSTPTSTATSTPTSTSTLTPTLTSTPLPTFAAGPSATPAPVRVSVQRAGNSRLLVVIAANGLIERVAWPTVPNVAVETSEGVPITGGALTPPPGSTTAVFYIRKLSGTSATLPLTVTGAFPTWQTFVGGGPAAW